MPKSKTKLRELSRKCEIKKLILKAQKSNQKSDISALKRQKLGLNLDCNLTKK